MRPVKARGPCECDLCFCLFLEAHVPESLLSLSTTLAAERHKEHTHDKGTGPSNLTSDGEVNLARLSLNFSRQRRSPLFFQFSLTLNGYNTEQ